MCPVRMQLASSQGREAPAAYGAEEGRGAVQCFRNDMHRSRLPFLANFTTTYGLASSFDCGSLVQRAEVMHALLTSLTDVSDETRSNTAFKICLQAPLVGAHLFAKTYAIASGLKSHMESHGGQDPCKPEWSSSLESICCGFFCPANLRRFLVAYWALWLPNYPVFHKPTFNEETAPPTLIAAMVLIGACLSPCAGDRESALHWIDIVGDWVFSSPDLNDAAASNVEAGVRARLDALRAGYCVVLLQTWEGGEQSKRAARRARYTFIIGVARSLSSGETSHGDLQQYIGAGSNNDLWKAFALVEQLIRTLIYVLLLDCGFCIFNNTPPRMTLEEARIAVPCPEACFQADSPASWAQAMAIWAASDIGRRQPTVRLIMSLLAKEQLGETDSVMLRQMSSLGLFTVVSCESPSFNE